MTKDEVLKAHRAMLKAARAYAYAFAHADDEGQAQLERLALAEEVLDRAALAWAALASKRPDR